MHPALYSWRDHLHTTLVRVLAYLGGITVLSIGAAHIFQSPQAIIPIAPVDRPPWIEVERPFPAFALTIPEAAGAASHYTILHNRIGGGRKDILTLGDDDNVAPYLQVEIYRPGNETRHFANPAAEIAAAAAGLGPVQTAGKQTLDSKFGPLAIVPFETTKGTPRHCLGFVRAYDDPRLQISGWFCQGGSEFITQSMLACALDRLTLLAAGSEPKVGALFAEAELHRSFCGQRDPILAPTPKYQLLWQALTTRPEPSRIGR
ncbi:MAG TPA: hypothetical protein VEJ40_08605 [Pseudolabrys sp.]|jgi:hypothetical protein|nr:hypothetical protein [Pseudolabrys sp.]